MRKQKRDWGTCWI